MTETFQCSNCKDIFHLDTQFYSETLDDAYCDDCGQQAEDDEVGHVLALLVVWAVCNLDVCLHPIVYSFACTRPQCQ